MSMPEETPKKPSPQAPTAGMLKTNVEDDQLASRDIRLEQIEVGIGSLNEVGSPKPMISFFRFGQLLRVAGPRKPTAGSFRLQSIDR